ncbi:rhomboid family intramembrane serine protease [Polyangium mundeleinium]|uniref:Rhomboid family intramembrane serine protease n=1 Tax=Polyangium mundeleinium TaxID=2995306 RepID=A0ABT5ET61_9BACT|nr:rhomboid family intramembrane serine protease [Polyangium mundeleinium]MDC0745007.1 rhomboid family intramembrane serine protease [Polyangium mundeleinium]
MKKPPPVSEFVRFPITAGVAMLAIFVTVLDASGRSIQPLVMNVRAFEGEPWRLVTSALPHANALHLIFNIAWLWTLGTMLEERFGSFRLLGLVLLFAAGSAAAEYAAFVGGIGLSGVVYGLFGLAWVLDRADARMRGTVDARTTQLFIGWFFFCIATTVLDVLPVANVAHGVGALLGVLVGLVITGGLRVARRRASVRVAAGLVVLLVVAASGAGATVLRPRVNLSKNGGSDSARLANEAFDAGNYDEAISWYRKALVVSPKSAAFWYNLGIAHARKNELDEATRAYTQAVALAPENVDMKRTLVDTKRYHAYTAQTGGKHDEAMRLYEEVLVLAGDDAISLYNLSLTYKELGRREEAAQLRARALVLDANIDSDPAEPSLDIDAGIERDAGP